MYAAYTEIVQALDGNDAFYCRYDSHAFLSRGASPVVYRNRIIGAVYAYEYDTQQAELLQRAFQTNLTRISLFIGILVVALSTPAVPCLHPEDPGPAPGHPPGPGGSLQPPGRGSGKRRDRPAGHGVQQPSRAACKPRKRPGAALSDASHELKTPWPVSGC